MISLKYIHRLFLTIIFLNPLTIHAQIVLPGDPSAIIGEEADRATLESSCNLNRRGNEYYEVDCHHTDGGWACYIFGTSCNDNIVVDFPVIDVERPRMQLSREFRSRGGNDINSIRVVIEGANIVYVYLGAGNDLFKALVGDFFHNRPAELYVYGQAGNDKIKGANTTPDYSSSPSDYETQSQLWRDIIYGGPGNDHIWGFAGDDTLIGGSGNDRIVGGSDDDIINGGNGNDHIFGDYGYRADPDLPLGDDSLRGGNGDDCIYNDGSGSDIISGGAGNDRITQGDDCLEPVW